MNLSILEKVRVAGASVIVVTKYFDREKTLEILEELRGYSAVLALGENRVDALIEKGLPRKEVHFIGNIQSRRILEIVQYSSVVHSLQKIEHAEKFASLLQETGLEMGFFIQINISRESQKSGVLSENFAEFLDAVQKLGLDIIGISAMGAGEFEVSKKREEFKELLALRDKYLPGKLISAGTSRDYEIALEEGIGVVRIGRALFENQG